MANEDYTLVRLDDNIRDKAVLTYDAVNDRITDSGMIASQGELKASAGTVSVGLQDMSSAGEQVVWRNKESQVTYAPPWHIVDEVNTEGSRDRIYGPLQEAVRFANRNDVLENPEFDVTITSNENIFRLHMTFPEAHDNVEFKITNAGHETWRQVMNISAGKQEIRLDTPISLYPGTYRFSIKPYGDEHLLGPVKVMGNAATGQVGYDVHFRPFREIPLATKEYVDAAVAGGGSGQPSGDVMLKTVYDIDNDGVVDEAKALQGAASAGNSKYYGTDSTGALGFHDVPSSEVSDIVHTYSFISTDFTPDVDKILNNIPFFIYEGSGTSTFNLVGTSTLPADVVITVSNKALTDNDLTIRAASGDTIEALSGSVLFPLPKGHSVALASDRVNKTWYIVGGLQDVDLSDVEARLKVLQTRSETVARELSAVDRRVDVLTTEIGKIGNHYTYRGKTVPTIPSEAHDSYFISLYALTKREDVTLPSVDIDDGTLFFLANEDTDNSVFVRAVQGNTVKGAAFVNVPPKNVIWLVRSGTDWNELLAGYLPSSYQSLLSDIQQALSTNQSFLRSLGVQGDDPNAQPLEVSKLSFTGCDVEHDPVDSKLAHIQPRLGVDFINPDGSRVNKVTEVKLVGMEIKKMADGTPPKLILLDHQNIPQPSTASAYAFFDASATVPDNVPFQSLPVFRGGRVTVHKDTTAPQYAYILIPPGEATDAERIGELGGIPSYWTKQSKDYNVGGQQRTYTVFRSPYPYHEQDVTLVIYP